VDHSVADGTKLLDRIADRVPELDLDRNDIEGTTLDDGHEALLVNGGGIDGGPGAYFANAGEDLHAVGSLDPLATSATKASGSSTSRRSATNRHPPLRPGSNRPSP
jgi:hypothetical protein